MDRPTGSWDATIVCAARPLRALITKQGSGARPTDIP
jgi:hypothetical protein